MRCRHRRKSPKVALPRYPGAKSKRDSQNLVQTWPSSERKGLRKVEDVIRDLRSGGIV